MNGARRSVLSLPSEPGMAAAARNAVRGLLLALPEVRLLPREVDEVAVVVQEACTNAIRHAHAMDPAKHFRVEILHRDVGLEIRVIDQGPPFELRDAPAPDPELLREGGYGLHIMRTWMDEVTVRHDGTGNVLTMLRRYRAETPLTGEAVAGGV